MGKKANERPLIFAAVGNGDGGTVATGRDNFYWIRLIDDDNRLTQCFSILPLSYDDLIYIRETKGEKLRYYEFVAFIQDAATGTAPPTQAHDHADAAHGGQLDWDDIWTDAEHDHSTAAEGNATKGDVLIWIGW